MAIVTINDTYLTQIADAIRTKLNSTATYTTATMADHILSIPVNGNTGSGGDGTTSGSGTYVIQYGTEVLDGLYTSAGIPIINTITWTTTSYNADGTPKTTLKTIKRKAFKGQLLHKVDIPASVETVEDGAFDDALCSSDVSEGITIICRGTTLYGERAFSASWFRSDGSSIQIKITLYVPQSIVEQARAHYIMAGEAETYIRAIEDYPDICG